jgi:hypothetical protein
MKRHPDGRWRNTRTPMIVSETVRRARWVEPEVVHLKRMGLSFDAIAEQITRVGRGQAQPITPLPTGVSFPPDYQISRQACHKAFRKAIVREPSLAVEELRKIDHARSEDMFMNLQPAIRKGNLRAIETGVKVLDHQSRTNGYAAPHRIAQPMGAQKRISLEEDVRSIPLSVIDALTADEDRVQEIERRLFSNPPSGQTSSTDGQSDSEDSDAPGKSGSR